MLVKLNTMGSTSLENMNQLYPRSFSMKLNLREQNELKQLSLPDHYYLELSGVVNVAAAILSVITPEGQKTLTHVMPEPDAPSA